MSKRTIAVVTGRMRGYTDELDAVERELHRFIEMVRDQADDNPVEVRRGIEVPLPSFKVTDRKVIGSRGWFTKHFISKYEYEFRGVDKKQAEVFTNLLERLIARIS